LSGGEKKRVSIAGILAMEPDILVLDEPTSGLDPKGRDGLLDLFTAIHNDQNKTVLLITHDMNIVYKYANRVLVMSEGELVFDGTPIDLFQTGDLEAWNLDQPDLLVLTNVLEEQFGITIKTQPKTTHDLFLALKEAMA